MAQAASDKPVHTIAFRRRRALNWLTLGFTYATMYMGRYNLSFANKALSDTYGWDKTQIGSIISIALTIYGVSALFNGPVADRIGGRKAMFSARWCSILPSAWGHTLDSWERGRY
jgi:OPA family glycerol-3-phosphate transporter-like MFS transporter